MWSFLKKSNKLWIWRAYNSVQRRAETWILGDRSRVSCQKLLEKVGQEDKIFITDDWEGYHRLSPEKQLYTGKDLTFPIEQDNSNICLPDFENVPQIFKTYQSRFKIRGNGRSLFTDIPSYS